MKLEISTKNRAMADIIEHYYANSNTIELFEIKMSVCDTARHSDGMTGEFIELFAELSFSDNVNAERYKPVEVEQVQADWYDYDKQQAITLPPVGEWVEYDEYQNQKWIKVQIRGFWTENNNTSVWIQSVGKPNVTKDKFRPLDYSREIIRKADEEKRKFVEAALVEFDKKSNSYPPTGNEWLAKLFEEMYDAGCRFTENKAAS